MARHILIVEDEPLSAKIEKQLLERRGYRVTTVESGEEALAFVRQKGRPDMILMDIYLGEGMDGTETARRILAEDDIPLIFLSAHNEPDVVARTEEITSYGYVEKNEGDALLLASIKMAFRLYESRRNYQDTFDNSLNGLCIHKMLYDEAGRPRDCLYIRVNEAFTRHTGLSGRDVNDKTIRDIYPGDQADSIIQLYAEVLNSREERRQTIYFDPTEQWFDLSIFPLHENQFTVSLQNITERVTAEKTLQEREAYFRRLFDDHSAVKLLIDPQDGRILNANRAAVQFYGWPKDELTRKFIQDINQLSQEEVQAEMDKARRGKRNFFRFVHRLADGSLRHVRVFSNAISLDGKSLLHSIIFDETEYQKQEDKLNREIREKSQLLTLITENIVDMVSLTDSKGRFIYAGQSYRRLGYQPEELLGRGVDELVHPEDLPRVREGIGRLMKEKREEYALFRYRCRDGSYRWLETLGRPVEALPGSIHPPEQYLFSSRDVTERKENLQKIDELLQQKDVLLREIHHRVKNNLSSIMGLLRLRSQSVSKETKDVLDDSISRLSTMQILYDQLHKRGDMENLEMDSYLRELVEKVISAYGDGRTIKSRFSLEKVTLPIDQANNLGILVNELLVNALKHAFDPGQGGEIHLALKKEKDSVILSMEDNGKGLESSPGAEDSAESGFGHLLIETLCRSLGGEPLYDQSPRGGVRFRLEMKEG